LAVGVGAASEEFSMAVLLRYLDVVLVAIGAIPALALGAPAVGYAVGAGAWILQRIIHETDRRWISKVTEPRKQLGFNLFEAFGRIWLLAGGIVIAGLVERADGLTAALVILGAYSIALMIRLVSGPPQRRPSR
jgi:hypothetical protein